MAVLPIRRSVPWFLSVNLLDEDAASHVKVDMDGSILYVLNENVMNIDLSLEKLYWRNWEV